MGRKKSKKGAPNQKISDQITSNNADSNELNMI